MVENFREITKKDKIKGLSRSAWVFVLLFGVIAFIFFFLWGLVITLFIMMVIAILEYFDDDIYDIILMNFSNSFKTNYYA